MMAHRREMSPIERDTLCRLYAAQAPWDAIAAALGCTVDTAQRWADECGLPRRGRRTANASHDAEGWTEYLIQRLVEMWSATGPNGAPAHSAAAIARALKKTKNAVAAKAHRLNLPARESPILPPSAPPYAGQAGPERIGHGMEPLPAGHPLASVPAAPEWWEARLA